MAQALTPYQLPANPYGASPWAGNLQRLAAALGARWAGQDAAGIQEKQRAAQSQVLSRFLSAKRGRTGESQYGTRDIAGPPVDTFLPSTIMGQPYRISDDGQQIPGPDPLDPELLKAAGTTPGLFALHQEEAQLIGEERSEKKRLNYAKRRLAKAETADDQEFWLSEIDAARAAERQIAGEAGVAKQERGFAQQKEIAGDVPRKVFDTNTLEMVMVPTREWRANEDRYKAEMPKTIDVVETATGKIISVTKKMLIQDIAEAELGQNRKYGSTKKLNAREAVMQKVMKGEKLDKGEEKIWEMLKSQMNIWKYLSTIGTGTGTGTYRNVE
jgi:hypothetical protein